MPASKPEKFHCCEKCQNYWTCETKWYRGENDQENICCELCNFYSACGSAVPQTTGKEPA